MSTDKPTNGRFNIRLCHSCGYRECIEGQPQCHYCEEQAIARQWREERIVEGHNRQKVRDE